MSESRIDSGSSPASEPRPEQVGRYRVVRRIGQGAMGTVYEAHDPDLRRRVALKLLRFGGQEARVRQGLRDRMRREAQALAQLSSDHVVTVYEVGVATIGGQERDYVSMQFVEGTDLATWLREHPVATRTRAERDRLLVIFSRAACGLAAAHAVGLVHRDFKPANVLLGDDGSVRVADFGLARAVAGTRDAVLVKPDDEVESGSALLLSTITQPGVIQGTPQYMSPEQLLGEDLDSRADQFSLCVALHEALYGVRPFAGRTFAALRRNVTRGHRLEPPPGVRVPSHLRKLLARGLRVDPDARFVSMQAVVDLLEREPRARLRGATPLVAAAMISGAVALGIVSSGKGPADTLCKHAAEHLSGIWDSQSQQAVRTAMVATGRQDAPEVFSRLSARLDRHFEMWVAAREDACRATHIRGEQSVAIMDLRMQCFDRRLSEARSLVELLSAEPDTELLDNAIEAAADLPGVQLCADTVALQALVPAPVLATRAAVAKLNRQLDSLEALQRSGKFRRGLELVTEVVEAAIEVDYAPVLARALYLRGQLEVGAGQFSRAEQTYLLALRAAGAAHDDLATVRILVALVTVLGDRQGLDAHTSGLAAVADSALLRVGDPPDLRAALLTSQGDALQTEARFSEALEFYQQAWELWERALAPGHPALALATNRIAVALYSQERFSEAEVAYRQALALAEQALGQDHPYVAAIVGNLGNAILDQGRPEQALPFHERALATRLRTVGPDNVFTANSLHSLGRVSAARKDYAAALSYFRRALATERAAMGEAYPDVGVMMGDVADMLRLLGRPVEARQYYLQGLSIAEATIGLRHPRLAPLLTGLCRAQHELGVDTAAVEAGERAVGILASRTDRAGALAAARYALAQALWAEGKHRARARRLGQEAYSVYASELGGDADQAAEVANWLGSVGSSVLP